MVGTSAQPFQRQPKALRRTKERSRSRQCTAAMRLAAVASAAKVEGDQRLFSERGASTTLPARSRAWREVARNAGAALAEAKNHNADRAISARTKKSAPRKSTLALALAPHHKYFFTHTPQI